jgi:hypothetical protein
LLASSFLSPLEVIGSSLVGGLFFI